jgi:hypothetical protein
MHGRWRPKIVLVSHHHTIFGRIHFLSASQDPQTGERKL